MSRKIASFVAGVLDVANALQPARQRGKTVANLMVALEERGARTVQTPHGELRFLTHRGRHVGGAVDNFNGNEPETLAWLDEIKPGEVLWDIGAAFGQIAGPDAACVRVQPDDGHRRRRGIIEADLDRIEPVELLAAIHHQLQGPQKD